MHLISALFFSFFFFFFFVFLRLQCLVINNTYVWHGWHSFFDLFTILAWFSFLFCDRAILGGLKTSVVQDYLMAEKFGPRKKCVAWRAQACALRYSWLTPFFPKHRHIQPRRETTLRVWGCGEKKKTKIKKKRRNATLNAKMKKVWDDYWNYRCKLQRRTRKRVRDELEGNNNELDWIVRDNGAIVRPLTNTLASSPSTCRRPSPLAYLDSWKMNQGPLFIGWPDHWPFSKHTNEYVSRPSCLKLRLR